MVDQYTTTTNSTTVLVLVALQLCAVSALLSTTGITATTKHYLAQRSIHVTTAAAAPTNNKDGEDLPCCPSSNFPLEFFKTPGNSDTPHNFGPASPLDSVLYTAQQPGKPCCDTDDDNDVKVSTDKVQEWIDYMRGQGVANVISLLSDDELAIYEEPGLKEMLTQAGMKCYIAPMGDLGACDRVFGVIRQAEAAGEKVVCHCTGGVGRAGRVAAGWLVHRYSVSPEVATLIVLDQAYQSGVKRLGHTEKLSNWIGYC